MRGAAARNILKAWVLVAILAGIFGGVGWLLADERGAALFAFASLLAAAGAYAAADRTLLGMLGARQFALAEDPLLRSTVDRLSARIGIAPPRLQLLDDGFPRAFVVGRNPRSSTKGEQLQVALFGGEYQDGVLTAYCYVDDVAHIELNGHILIPLQNVASLHCSSRCDAPEPDWPPHGLAEDDTDERDDEA